jgi:exodeoxyribonuclease VII small subunit
MTRKAKALDFEQSLRELETLVEKLEHGELPLEDALKHFERGVALTRECQAALKAAEARVELLTRQRDPASGAEVEALTDFDADDDAEPPLT